MSGLLEEIDEIIDHAKGNFFPASNLLRHALVVAKKVDDEEFEDFILKELKGYKSGPLPRYRRVRGEVFIRPPYGAFSPVSLDNLDARAKRKVSTAQVRESIPAIESTIQSQGDGGILTVGFGPENEGVLPPPSGTVEYVILLSIAQAKELLDDVRREVLSWAVKLHRERTEERSGVVKVDEAPSKEAPGSRSGFLSANKHWMFEGIGTEAVKTILWVLFVLAVGGGGGLLLLTRQSDDAGSNKSVSNSATAAQTAAPTPEPPPAAAAEVESARGPAQYTYEQLRARLKDKSKAEVMKLLGRPFSSSDYGGGHESWAYQNIAYDPVTKNVATVAVITFRNGRVEEVSFG